MGRDCRCFGGGGGVEEELNRDNSMIHLVRQKESRRQHPTVLLNTTLLLLNFFVGSAALIAVVTGEQFRHPAAQPPQQPPAGPPDVNNEERRSEVPRAMLTVRADINPEEQFLKWENETGNAFCEGGFSYSDGNLSVPRAGWYRVFLQITYEYNSDTPSDQQKLINTVSHYRESYKGYEDLLSSTETVCWKDGSSSWKKSLYTSGLFKLEANTKLRVQSTLPHLIVRRQQEVFFGAELLPR